MEDDKKDINSGIEKVKEQGESFKEQADKTKKTIKIFMKIPKSIQIAIIVAVLMLILVIVLTSSLYVIKKWKFEHTVNAKTSAMGNGTSYSKNVVTIGTDGTWDINISDEIKQKLIDNGIDISGMSQDEILMEYLKLNGLEQEALSQEEVELIPYLIKAEIASQSVDLRSASEMYSNGKYNLVTEEQINENLKNNKINGVVHFKRVNTGGKYESLILEYTDYATFSNYINNNNYEEGKKYFSFNDKGELVIATWRYNKIEYKLSDGYIPNPYTSSDFQNSEQAYVSEMVIDYKPLISKYTVPFEVLAVLLENSDDVEFTKKVANLGFTTNIEITIFEKYTKTETETTTNYYEYIRNYQWINMYTTYEQNNNVYTIRDDSYVFLEGDNNIDTDDSNDKITDWEAPEKIENIVTTTKNKHNSTYKIKNFTDDKSSYKVLQKITTEDNTYVYGLTLADSWFIKTEKTYNINPSNNNTESEGEYIGTYSKEDSYNTSKKEEIDSNRITIQYLDDFYNNKKSQIEAKSESKKNEIENNVINPTVSINDKEDRNGNKEKYILINCGYTSTIQVNNSNGNTNTFYNSVAEIKYTQGDYIFIEDSHAKFWYYYNSNSNQFVLNRKEIKNQITNIQSNYSQRTDLYKKTDTKTKEVTIVNSFEITENAPTSKLYDNKDEKFLKAYDKSTKAKANIESSPGWLEDFLDEYSPEVTTILKYLIDKYNGMDVELDESITSELQADGFTNYSNQSSWDQFLKFLHSWEGGGKIFKNEEGVECYKVNSDGGGGTAVGYGIDIDTHGNTLRALGYDTSIGSLIPVEVVDEIEKDSLKGIYNKIKARTQDLNLTEYQKLALVSRCYNYGLEGGIGHVTSRYKYPSDKNFVSAYKDYYKTINNEEYFGDYTKTDFTNKLFTNYMTWLDYASTGTHPKGWEYRRKAEWSLFQTGYYGYDLKHGTGHGIDEYYADALAATDMTNNISLYNDDGTVNETAIDQLDNWITKDLLTTKKHTRDYAMQNGPFAKWWDSKNNWFTSAGYKFQCTWYVYGRANQYLELSNSKYKSWPGTLNNAWKWYSASTNGGEKYFECGSTPRMNSIVVWKNGNDAGHVAYVEAVDEKNQKVYISHAGSGKSWFGITSHSTDQMKNLWGYTLLGYVYLDNPK